MKIVHTTEITVDSYEAVAIAKALNEAVSFASRIPATARVTDLSICEYETYEDGSGSVLKYGTAVITLEWETDE